MRNAQRRAEGFVIKRINFKDQDKIVTLFTKGFGKISVLVKGARKIDSKRKSHFEPGNLIKLELIESGKLYIAAQTEIVKTYSTLKEDLKKITALYYILEILDPLCPESESNKLLFKFFEKTIHSLENLDKNKITNFLNAYTLKILRISGFLNDPSEILSIKNKSECYKQIDFLINNTYEKIMDQETNPYLEGEIFNLIKIFTENILEKKIKSL